MRQALPLILSFTNSHDGMNVFPDEDNYRRHAFVLFSYSFASMAPIERLTDKLEAPALDDRSYRVIRLPNKLEALLVHDSDIDKAGAAVSVNVGSFSDADDTPGIAHAVEHLLFEGTKKVRSVQLSPRSRLCSRSSTLKRMTLMNTFQRTPDTRMPIPKLQRRITILK